MSLFKNEKLEKNIDQTEVKYQALFDNMTEAFALHEVVLDKKGNPVDYVFRELNKAFEKSTGLQAINIIGKKVTEVIPGTENDPVDWIGKYGKVALSQEPLKIENFSKDLGRWYSVYAYSPQKGFFATIFQDITEKKEMEKKLKENYNLQQEIKVLIENINDVLYSIDKKGTVVFISSVIENAIGYKPEELIGKSFFEFIHPDDLAIIKKAFSDILNKKTHPSEYRIKSKGKLGFVWIRSSSKAIIEDGAVNGVRGIFSVIENEKTAKEDLKKREAELNKAQEVANIGSWSYDIKTQKLKWSNQLFVIFGLDKTNGEPSFEDHKKYIYPDDWKYFYDSVVKAIELGVCCDIDIRLIQPSQKTVWVNVKCETRKENDKVVELIGTTQDITKKKETEDELRQKVDELRMFQKLTIGRELKMVELKKHLKEIEKTK